jgi:predicted dienelactone hydrolase
MINDKKNKFSIKLLLKSTVILIISSLFVSIPKVVLGAKDIAFNYGILEVSVSVDSLEKYAKTGEIASDLALLASFLTEKQLEDLQTLLTVKADLTPVAIAQFFYSPQGETILEGLGQIVQSQARQHGFYAIRSALILASADEEGLTLLNILKKFPLPRIKINSDIGFDFMNQLGNLIQDTQNIIDDIEEEFNKNLLTETPIDFQLLPDLRQTGGFDFEKKTFTVKSSLQDYDIFVDLYIPQLAEKRPLPLIIISHGLGSDRQTFAYLAKHLVSYGWMVAIPEHQGSNSQQLQQLLTGANSDLISTEELVERPLEIRVLLNKLAQDYAQEINFEQVGFLGQSLGAYTGLTLAGAEINLNLLKEKCPQVNHLLNLSLLLQCRILESPRNITNFKDYRIKALVAINPLNSLVFGEKNLNKVTIPSLFVAGTSDPITPAITEQIFPFTWLNSQDKYLLVLKQGTHFSSLDEVEGDVTLPSETIGPDPAIAHEYLKVITLAFFNSYVRDKPQYNYYLSSRYAQYINQESMPLLLLKNYQLPE